MSHTPHELAADFPEYAEQLHLLKESDAHFQKLADAYHTLNREIHRAETNVEPTSDEHLTEMRKRRMVLKDDINTLLKAAAQNP
ncbi:YdcH family protein [Hyphobacterium sp. CCMP332]|uniref:YdcH family protein n=1 Tax=Hyphobacterium sp. CCMP332 TaxID=2749086 RepID=UPI00164EF43B|nr:YdcH family protein [Hyphobacterium sp. CCMP332]QNL19938.1 YdcH family protein [Hyphobacterium sp. CCMP332]